MVELSLIVRYVYTYKAWFNCIAGESYRGEAPIGSARIRDNAHSIRCCVLHVILQVRSWGSTVIARGRARTASGGAGFASIVLKADSPADRMQVVEHTIRALDDSAELLQLFPAQFHARSVITTR